VTTPSGRSSSPCSSTLSRLARRHRSGKTCGRAAEDLPGTSARTLGRTMRTRLTWVVVGALAAIVVAAAVDAFRSPGRPSSSPSEASSVPVSTGGSAFEARDPVAGGETAPLPRCTAQQIAMAIEVLGGSASIVVRHVWGKPCHLARLPIDLAVWDRTGRRVRLAEPRSGVPQSGIAGDFSPRFERLVNITYLADCDQRQPFLAVVNVGPYVARGTLSAKEIGCFRGG
jgi:hypothetical protein